MRLHFNTFLPLFVRTDMNAYQQIPIASPSLGQIGVLRDACRGGVLHAATVKNCGVGELSARTIRSYISNERGPKAGSHHRKVTPRRKARFSHPAISLVGEESVERSRVLSRHPLPNVLDYEAR